MNGSLEKLEVLFEDNHLLVVNKPPLLPTMGVAADEPSLHRLAQDYLRQKYDKPGNVYVGIVSRIDAHVSGVVVLARTSKAASRLSDQFRRGTPKKIYWALIAGTISPAAGQLRNRLLKSESRRRMVVLPPEAQPQANEREARLSYATLAATAKRSLLEIKLETGRKHQIRVQLENAGFPIIGDRKYGSAISFPHGVALHSRRLTIQHPTKKTLQTFESAPPSWWQMEQFPSLQRQ